MKQKILSHQFVKFIPEQLKDGVLYISKQYSTAAHKCCCGCGMEVITSLKPTDWSLQVKGNQVTLYPSIGNWGFPCQSHYWIRNSKIIWAGHMTQLEINRGRSIDRNIKKKYYDELNKEKLLQTTKGFSRNKEINLLDKLLLTIKHWFSQ